MHLVLGSIPSSPTMNTLKAYRIEDVTELPIVPAPERRAWHKDIPGIGACLPLTIGNGAGWWLLNPKEFRVSRLPLYNNAVVVHGKDVDHVASHFGFGVLTVLIPYVFRTPPGWELLIRGPSNVFYDGMHPFEGIVESDWHKATATMNWMVEEGTEVVIPKDSPLAQIVPVQMEALESFQPEILDMPVDVEQEFTDFANKRMASLVMSKEKGKTKYMKVYPKNDRTRRRHLRLKSL